MVKKSNNRLIHTLSKLLAERPVEGARLVEIGQLEQLLGIYYRHISPADLDEHDPEDLLGTVLWLLSPASAFVTGIVVPVDGGFSAFGGV